MATRLDFDDETQAKLVKVALHHRRTPRRQAECYVLEGIERDLRELDNATRQSQQTVAA